MQKGIIGKKIGMTQIFDEKGNVIPGHRCGGRPLRCHRRRKRWKTTVTMPCSSVLATLS